MACSGGTGQLGDLSVKGRLSTGSKRTGSNPRGPPMQPSVNTPASNTSERTLTATRREKVRDQVRNSVGAARPWASL